MKGILFKPEMNKAIREGRKTVTRRLMKLANGEQVACYTTDGRPDLTEWALADLDGDPIDKPFPKCRYLPGETVYVKEAWALFNNDPAGEVLYRLDFGRGEGDEYHWHSPMFLPEKYARTFLLIKDVRPERLREISDADAIAEGIYLGSHTCLDARIVYADLWDSINKPPHDWAANPWVWRIEFEVKP